MRKRADVPARAIALAAAVVMLLAVQAARAAAVHPAATTCAGIALADEKPACCFSNSSYVGVCRVQPAEEETCASILTYLNTTLSTGKSYCNNTEIRGGWQQVACDK